VFFRAGALAALEEARDEIVLKLVRWLQGVNFINILPVPFSCESAFTALHSFSLVTFWLWQKYKKHFRTKNACINC